MILSLRGSVCEDRASTRLSTRDDLKFLSEELDLVNDESFSLLTSSSSVFEANAERSSRDDVYVTESNSGKVNFLKLHSCTKSPFDCVIIRLVDLFDKRRDLSIKPFLRALNAVPENQVLAQDFLKKQLWHYELHVVKSLRHHKSLSNILTV